MLQSPNLDNYVFVGLLVGLTTSKKLSKQSRKSKEATRVVVNKQKKKTKR